jgi:5-methylcytosine-specific restriction endonuclease McrBC GTP-binding regulatory subunit McrB
VLIIDEINRANLPAVLGELIYALEYRGKPVTSMYEYEEERDIILPKNLFIIGTMNTADRSVGHIDYAIRRRFAFVDVLSKRTVLDDAIKNVAVREKAKRLFDLVDNLFNENISADFAKKDVVLGHSYFLAESEDDLKLKLEFEIKSILREYVRDGLLQDTAKDIIESLYV